MNDRYRRLYLQHVFDLLGGGRRAEIVLRAQRVILLWRGTDHMAPFYADRWSHILALPADTARAIVFADTPEGDMLRHCTPFAGILGNSEKAKLRRAADALAEAS